MLLISLGCNCKVGIRRVFFPNAMQFGHQQFCTEGLPACGEKKMRVV
jgi:hypothetical protein